MASRLFVASLVLSLSAATTVQAEPESTPHPRCEVLMTHNTQRAEQISNVLYLNRCIGGCDVTVVSTVSDAPNFKSTIPYEYGDQAEGTVLHLPEHTVTDQMWNDTVACVRERMRPYNIVVTDQDPGASVPHHMSLLTNQGADIGYDSPGLGGISQLSYDCSPIDNVISFIFGSLYNNATELCETIAHEAGHAYGLEHIWDCEDLMTYRTDCSYKYFRNEGMRCAQLSGSEQPCMTIPGVGTWCAEQCMCTGNVQNTHLKLISAFGAGEGAFPPTVELISPTADATVASDFRVYATASDNRGVTRVELWINGWKWATKEAPATQFNFSSPGNLPDGYLDIDVVAYNDLETAGTASVTVLKGSPCSNADTCLDGQACTDGRCAWPAPATAFGELCERDQDCLEGTCQSYEGEQRCTESCYPSVADQCSAWEDSECVGTGTNGLCWPASGGGGGGCCSVDETTGVPWLIALFTAVILLAGGPKRRRRRDV